MKKTTGPAMTDTEKERVKVLSASGKSPNEIARSKGRNRRTVAKYLDKPEVRKVVAVQKEEMAGMFDSVAHRIVNSVTDTDVEKANLVQKITSAAIAVDKAALLRGTLPSGGINLVAVVDLVRAGLLSGWTTRSLSS